VGVQHISKWISLGDGGSILSNTNSCFGIYYPAGIAPYPAIESLRTVATDINSNQMFDLFQLYKKKPPLQSDYEGYS
jgi:hypothetical protein